MMEVIWNGAHGGTNADLLNGPWHHARPLPMPMRGATTTGQILALLQPGEVVTSREMWARLQADPAPGYFSVSTSMARLGTAWLGGARQGWAGRGTVRQE